jgi:hypothetical protein
MKSKMNTVARVLMFAPILLAGCQASRNVASTSYHVTRGAAVGSYKVARAVAVESYHVATAPVHYVTGKRGDESYTTASSQSMPSDVTNPGEPVPPPENVSTSQRQARVGAEGGGQSRTSGGTTGTSRKEAGQSSSGVLSSRSSAPSAAFPTGKSVPGKPGYVFSPFDKEGRYVDVSGFPSGTKVKDPWTDKIFIVP